MRTVRIREHPLGFRADWRVARAESAIAYSRARPRNRIAIVPEGESAAVRTPGLRFILPSEPSARSPIQPAIGNPRPEAPGNALRAIVADWRMSVPDNRPPRPGWILALPGASFIRLAGSRGDGASGRIRPGVEPYRPVRADGASVPCAFVRESREPMALPGP